MLTIEHNQVFGPDGEHLKTIACPKRASMNELAKTSETAFECTLCEHPVIDTDRISESALIALLREEPDTCLRINKANPMFEVR